MKQSAEITVEGLTSFIAKEQTLYATAPDVRLYVRLKSAGYRFILENTKPVFNKDNSYKPYKVRKSSYRRITEAVEAFNKAVRS